MDIAKICLKLYREVEVWFDSIYPTLKNFPRFEQPSTVALIKDKSHSIMSRLLQTHNSQTLVKNTFRQNMGDIHYLISLWNFAYRHRFINQEFHNDVIYKLNVISHNHRELLSG